MMTVVNFIATSRGCLTRNNIEQVEASWPMLKGWLEVRTTWTGEERVVLTAGARSPEKGRPRAARGRRGLQSRMVK